MANDIEDRLKRIEEFVDKVIFFPGSKQEYETMVGYQVKIVNLPRKEKGVSLFYDDHSHKWCTNGNEDFDIYRNNVEAIVNCQTDFHGHRYGLPVTKIENPPDSQLLLHESDLGERSPEIPQNPINSH